MADEQLDRFQDVHYCLNCERPMRFGLNGIMIHAHSSDIKCDDVQISIEKGNCSGASGDVWLNHQRQTQRCLFGIHLYVGKKKWGYVNCNHCGKEVRVDLCASRPAKKS